MRIHELHAPVKVVQRSKGRSATAAAAYRAGVAIEDERTGVLHDYTRKRGVEADALLLPDNAPEWAHDRGKLWNGAELNEKHPRAQTAREVTVSFPSEFNDGQRREAGMKIGQWILFRHGAAVDVAWHEPSKDGDQRNNHAHFLFTTRRFDENGQWAKTKDRTLDDLKKGPEEITTMRLGIADVLNNIAARDKLEVYVEHLSYEKRGLDREATQHVGPIATEMEREGIKTDIGDKNREITARNEERRRLLSEQKVIDIDIARESLKARQENQSPADVEKQAARAAQDDPYEVFYRETQGKRSMLLEGLERQHAEREKALRQEIAGLANSLDNANFFTRVWRNVTGRTKAEKEQMATAASTLSEIQRERQAAHESFERDRQLRLEALKAAQREREAQQEQQPLARAVGDAQPAPARPPNLAQTLPATQQAPSPPGTDYEARRRAYFQRLGSQRKAEDEQPTPQAEQLKTPARLFAEARKPKGPEPAKDFEQAASGGTEQAPGPPADPGASATTNYEARKAAYMRRVHRQQERRRDRDSGPTHERE